MPIDTLMRHSISANTKNNAKGFSHNTIQGHHHTLFDIVYNADSLLLNWAMTVGCYLDPRSLAARYAKNNVLKPSQNDPGNGIKSNKGK